MTVFTQEDLLNAIEKEPLLTNFGIGIFQSGEKMTIEERQEEFQKERELLKDNLEQFQICCNWLTLCQKRKTVNLNIDSSYGLKHRVENHFKSYVSNGSFIAAIIYLEIPYKIYPSRPNINVALSSKLPPLPSSTSNL